MEEKRLLKIAIITGLVGLCILFFILQITSLPLTPLENASTHVEGTKLKVLAHIDSVYETNKTLLLQLDTYTKNSVQAVYFKKRFSTVNVTKDMIAELEVTPYNGKLIINSINCLEKCN